MNYNCLSHKVSGDAINVYQLNKNQGLIKFKLIKLFNSLLSAERRLEPMQVLINYMNERYIRPSELFRIMDKDVDAMMTEEEFIQRLKVGSNALQIQK
jgi:hypothetical protein